MSEQTKKQALGYVARALFDVGIPSRQLKDLVYNASEVMSATEIYDNYDVMGILESICNDAEMSEGEVSKCRSSLYWCFDDITVERAGELLEAFIEFSGSYRLRNEV